MAEEEPKLTAHIKLVARGKSDNGQRFCKFKVKGDMGVKTLVVRENRLADYRDDLEAIGANVVSKAAFRELERRVQAFGLTKPTLDVVTRIEIRDGGMALPGGSYPKTNSFEVALTDVPKYIEEKYTTAGPLRAWKKEFGKVGRQNSRMILAFALPFIGPMSAVLPIEHVGIQLLGEGGSGISAVSIAASSIWGWDPDPVQADRNGFGQSWNSTAKNLERWAAGYNQTFLLLNETKAAGETIKEAAVTVLDAVIKIEGSSGRGRLTEEGVRRWFAPLLSTSKSLSSGVGKTSWPRL